LRYSAITEAFSDNYFVLTYITGRRYVGNEWPLNRQKGWQRNMGGKDGRRQSYEQDEGEEKKCGVR
jgi:hypothetical protein